MSKLYAGPWCGEFGHEIMSWQSQVRLRAKEFTSVCIGCVPTSRALYADFATEFWDVPFDLNTTGSSRYSKAHTALEVKFGRQGRKFDWMRPHVFGKGESRGRFIRYGTRHPGAHYDVIVHARDMVKGSKGGDRRRCSPRAFWDSLSDAMKGMGLEVACIGLKEGALTLPHAADMRGVELQTVMDILASSSVIVGPSSGPIHLAALCDCPQVVWTDTKHRAFGYTNLDRLTKAWNPFDVQVRVFHVEHDHNRAWIPDLDAVLGGVEEIARQGIKT